MTKHNEERKDKDKDRTEKGQSATKRKSCKMKQNGDSSLRCGTQQEGPGLDPTTACPLWSFALYVGSMMRW